MQNNETSAVTNAEQSKNVDDTSVSQTIAKPNVGRSAVNKWVAVKDRLPEKMGYYLVVVDKIVSSKARGVVEISDLYDGVDIEKGERILKFQDYVTHWMPIPTPPNECL